MGIDLLLYAGSLHSLYRGVMENGNFFRGGGGGTRDNVDFDGWEVY